ncbi:MAG TPA: hypothetical protein VGB85_32405, partial [Nannocystis sp.]
MTRPSRPVPAACLALLTLLAACGDDTGTSSAGSTGTTDPASSSTAEPGTTSADPPTTGTGTTEAGSADGGATESPTTSPGTTGNDTIPGTATGSTSTTGSTTDETTGEDTTTGVMPLEHFLLGVHVQDVSPSPEVLSGKDVYMGAYGAPYTRGPAQGVHDPIFARSFAVEGNGGGIIMSIVDLPGMGNRITRDVRTKVAALTGLDEAQVLIGSTHSHSAPDFMGLWGGVPGDYRTWLIDQVSASMAAAWDARVPGELRVSTGKAPANNRRGWNFTDDD